MQASLVYSIALVVILSTVLFLFNNMLRYPLIDEKFNPEKYKIKEEPKKKNLEDLLKRSLIKRLSHYDLMIRSETSVIQLDEVDSIKTEKSIAMN